MSVAIRRDGSVERADVIQSSGIKLLDAAAMRIAKLDEPYPPLPRTEENIDVLNVTRTWNFLPGGEPPDERRAPTATYTPRLRPGTRTRQRHVHPDHKTLPGQSTDQHQSLSRGIGTQPHKPEEH